MSCWDGRGNCGHVPANPAPFPNGGFAQKPLEQIPPPSVAPSYSQSRSGPGAGAGAGPCSAPGTNSGAKFSKFQSGHVTSEAAASARNRTLVRANRNSDSRSIPNYNYGSQSVLSPFSGANQNQRSHPHHQSHQSQPCHPNQPANQSQRPGGNGNMIANPAPTTTAETKKLGMAGKENSNLTDGIPMRNTHVDGDRDCGGGGGGTVMESKQPILDSKPPMAPPQYASTPNSSPYTWTGGEPRSAFLLKPYYFGAYARLPGQRPEDPPCFSTTIYPTRPPAAAPPPPPPPSSSAAAYYPHGPNPYSHPEKTSVASYGAVGDCTNSRRQNNHIYRENSALPNNDAYNSMNLRRPPWPPGSGPAGPRSGSGDDVNSFNKSRT